MPTPRSGSFASPVDGLTITTWTWDDVTEPPRGVVQVVHGLAERGRRYDRLAAAPNAAGFIVWTTRRATPERYSVAPRRWTACWR